LNLKPYLKYQKRAGRDQKGNEQNGPKGITPFYPEKKKKKDEGAKEKT